MDKLVGLLEAYCNHYSETSLTINLSDIVFELENNHGDDENSFLQKIHFNGASAFAAVNKNKKIHRHLLQDFHSIFWLPIYPLKKNNFAECFYFQKDRDSFVIKFITFENTSVSNIDFIKTFTSCLQQLIPSFGTVLSLSELELPYAFIGEIYTFIDFKKYNASIDINIFGNYYQLGKIRTLKFEVSENSKITLSIIQSIFKKPTELNLDQNLWRNGFDSLKIATLEFKLKSAFDGIEKFEHGFCLKLQCIRQLLEITNSLVLKQAEINTTQKCDLTLEKLPITEAQKQLLFLCKTENGNDFVEEFCTNFITPLKVEKIKEALIQTMKVNPSLRSIFGIDYAKLLSIDQALMIFTDKELFEIYEFDVFSKTSLIFFLNENVFAMKFHHILMDGKSLQIFVNQLMAFYYGNNTDQNLNYFDFALFETNFLASTNFTNDIKYWITKLSGVENFPKLPKDSNIASANEYGGSIIAIELPSLLTTMLQKFCSSNSISLFSTFIAFYRLFIYKLYGFIEFPFLISIDNRLDEAFQNTCGLFVNLATVSFTMNPNERFETLLKETTKNLTETISHSTVPFNKVVSALRNEISAEPEIPEVMLVQDREASFKGAEILSPSKKKFIQNSQIWYLKEAGDKLKLQIEFRNALCSPEVMQNQAERFLILIEKVLLNPKIAIKSFELLTEKEENQFLEFRQSLSNPIPVISPIQLIFQKMESNLHKIILKTETEHLTSEELMKKVIQYAKKVKEIYEARFKRQLPLCDQPVALLLQRSIDLIICVLASWYLNLAPLMITIDWPADRISKSLKGFTNLLFITDNENFDENMFDDSVSVVSIKSFHIQNPRKSPLPMASSNPTDLAYLTFTSGSTGTPKAVKSLQRGLINLWQNYSHHFSISSKSTVYQVVNPAFDIFFADIISALGNGATLFLASQKIPKMSELKQCTHAYIMPAYLSQLDLDNPEILEILKNLDGILYGGEAINPNFMEKALKVGLNLYQQFGVTEHSIYSNFLSPKSVEDRFIVGQNFDNFHGYLIDSDGCRLPPKDLGIQGWFRSAGIAVARGYSSEIAKQVFGEEKWFDGWKYFDSGDRMKYIPSVGNRGHENPWNCKFIFCGRNDAQIKIRGNRIELRDIEEPFRRHSNIEEIICLFDGSKLTAFISFKSQSLKNNEKELIEYAQEKLPNYMIPEKFIILQKFPLNSNGKIDRQKLLSMLNESILDSQNVQDNANTSRRMDTNELSKICCKIFSKHLKVPSLFPEDDVFHKGADSLKLLMAVQEIEDTVGMKLDLAAIFRVRSISKVLELLYKSEPNMQKQIMKSTNENDKSEIQQLSYSQEHLWFIEKLNQENSTNVSTDAYILKFKINLLDPMPENRWNDLIKFLVTKHPILRTQIIENNGIPYQQILQIDDKLVQKLRKKDTVDMNILNEPPVKFKISTDFKVLKIGCHHIAIDGYSLNILINDIQTFFTSQKPLTVIPDYTYFDFVKHQRSNDFSKDLQFFQQKLANLKNFSSSTDYPRFQCSSFKAGHYRLSFEIHGLDGFLHKFKISETHLILGIFALQQFILKSEANEIVVGLPFANRSTTFSSTVGYFVNVHAIPISRPSSTEPFHKFLTQIKDTVLEILSHSSTPFELVVRHLKPKREINKPPIFQQMLIFEDLRNPTIFDTFEVTEIKSNEAKLDQTWRIKRIKNDTLEIDIEFIEALFKKETIEKSAEKFKSLLTKALGSKIVKINDFRNDETPQKFIENLWKEILEIDKIDEDANFFEEGGHSLLAARLTSMINAKFGIKASINLLFEHQTFKEYFEAIEKLLFNEKDESKIEIKNKKNALKSPKIFPVNPLQIPLLELLRKASESGNISLQEAYVNQIQIQCPNETKLPEIKNILEQLIERHTVLRSKFGYTKTDTTVEYFQEIIDLEYCKTYLLSTSKFSTMNIFEDSVFRASMNENILTLEISHLISDGHSMNILAKDLFALFTKQTLPELKINYFNFNEIFIHSVKQQQKEQSKFWSKIFSNLNYSPLETDFNPINFDYSSATISKTWVNANSTLAQAVKMHRCSPLTLLLHSFAFRFREKFRDFNASLKIAFCKDIRPSENYYSCIGFFINTLIIPIEAIDTIHDIEQKVQNAQKYSWITVDDLRQLSANDKDNNLFDAMIVIDNSPVIENNEKLNVFQIIETKQNFTKFDLTIFVQINGRDLNVKAEYRKCLWSDETIKILLNSWESDGFEEKVSKISKALQQFYLPNKVITVDFDQRDITVILLEIFERYSNNVALKTADVEMTYAELQKQVIQISNQIKEEYLKATGCIFIPDTIIPVISKNSIEQWLICLGIIFAGGAYLPIDMQMPEERILNILEQMGPTLIISDVNIRGYKSIDLKKLKSSSSKAASKLTNANPACPHNLAYIIFTSGTTGIPKGVCINRLGLSNLISDAQKFFSIDSNSVIYQFTNFCFDNSVLEIFAALGSGAACFIPDGYFTADKFCQNVDDYGITHAMLFPGLVETFDYSELVQLKKLKCWICGAEKLSKNLFQKATNLGINIIQNYGPTETTAYCLRKKLGPNDDPQNLGKPIQNAVVSVRRPDGWEAMVGDKFELFISSIGLTRGYLGREWKDQPFVTFGDGLLYYPSGDICQRLPSGDIRFIGRKDNQIKIRGFRIELDEIESCLLGYPGITAAKVLLNQKMEDIIAFYSSKHEIETKLLKEFLKKKLPYYMIPRFFVYLKSFPLTSNSKIDTKKLLKYETKQKTTNTGDTKISMEATIKEIWQKILKLDSSENFDSNDSFFYLGGNSLTVQKLITAIKNDLKIEIRIEEFYRNPTINSIMAMSQTTQITTTFEPSTDKVPLSYQQEQMLYLEQIDPESSYNLAFIQEFDKTLDIEKLKYTFYQLLEENPEFRTIFKESEDGLELYQEVLSIEKCFINVKVEAYSNSENEQTALKEFKQKKFNLFNEIPLRAKILETFDRYIILLIIHHAFSDATTTMLMEKEMSRIYQDKKRSTCEMNQRMSYQQYSIQQKSENFKRKFEALTTEYLKDYGSSYKLLPAKIESIFEANNFSQFCETFKFRISLSRSKFTSFTLLTAAIAKTFLPLFPEDSFLLLGCPFANRTSETSETFGNFLNNLLLPLTSKHSNKSFDDLQLELLNLLKYGVIPFQCLCKRLRQKTGITSLNIQIYLNCRYHLENEGELNFEEIESIKNKVPVLHGIFEEIINYPIEIDVDELQSTEKTADKIYEITVRISKSFFESNEKMVKEICENFQREAQKCFGQINPTINENMLVIFNKFLQADLTKADFLEKSFIDLGGDSIMAMKLRRSVLKETGIELDLRDLMTAKTVSEILNPNQSSKNEGIIEFHKNQYIHGSLIIFVYPLVGGCLIYSSLIKHLKALQKSNIQCIIGFHPPSALPKTMEDLAAFHKSQLLKSYHLTKYSKIIFIGASFGAALAYQMCNEFSSTLQSINLISIDGTLATPPSSIPTFEGHKNQITDIIAKFSKDTVADNFETEIQSSWKLLQIAANYIPKPLLTTMKCWLLYTSGSENLQNQWKNYIRETTAIKIEGSHETMLSADNSEKIAKIIISNL